MKLRIPRDMRGVTNAHVLTINLNDFDIDLFLPSLFLTVLGNGAPTGRRGNEPTQLQLYVSKLASHPDLEGFEGKEGARLLDRIVRADLVVLGRKGRSRKQEQILALRPYSLLVGKSGLPKVRTRQRGVDAFLYHALLSAQGAGSKFESERTLYTYFKRVFGRGVNLKPLPEVDGTYDGATPLDTLTRLSLAFLDGLDATTIDMRKQGGRRQPRASCPAQAAALGDDLLGYLFGYSSQMPAAALTYNVQALINVELFVYTLNVVYAINALVDDSTQLPPAMADTAQSSPPELYLDFTGEAGSLSQAMATYCVRRDIEAYQRFLTSNLLLRQLDKYVEQLRRIPARAARIDAVLDGATEGPRYLQGLMHLLDDDEIGPQIQARAGSDEDKIRGEYIEEESDHEADMSPLEEAAAGADSELGRVVGILTEGQRENTLKQYTSWFWSVGGLKKPHGILVGSSKSRLSWRYAPSNDLLAVLVQLAAIRVDPAEGERDSRQRNANGPHSIRLQDFLTYLERRFGILIDRPPAPFAGAEPAAAARENLRAMLRRLRQMGIFSDLSDDFTVQRLRPPYTDYHQRDEHRAGAESQA